MTEPQPDGYKATRIHGGTEIAERVLAWAGTELVRRQQNQLDGDEARRERWDEVLMIYIEEFEKLSQRSRDQVERLAAQGRKEGILIAIRSAAPERPVERPWERAWNNKNEPFTPYFLDLDEIKQLIDDQLTEMNNRSTKKGTK